jgi:hypothetical protein
VKANHLRRRFIIEFGRGLLIVWPVLSFIVFVMIVLGYFAAKLEHWPFGMGLYFALITGFTVGYGDVIPHLPLVRALAVLLAFLGIVMTAIIAAVAVKAMSAAQESAKE